MTQHFREWIDDLNQQWVVPALERGLAVRVMLVQVADDRPGMALVVRDQVVTASITEEPVAEPPRAAMDFAEKHMPALARALKDQSAAVQSGAAGPVVSISTINDGIGFGLVGDVQSADMDVAQIFEDFVVTPTGQPLEDILWKTVEGLQQRGLIDGTDVQRLQGELLGDGGEFDLGAPSEFDLGIPPGL